MSEDRVRIAVGAVIYQNDEYLLIHKVKVMNGQNGIEDIKGIWDFPKGGVVDSDSSLEKAILRELKEETGSDAYSIVKRFNEKICFEFPKKHKYDRQETTVFYIEYLGDRTDLNPQDEEIDAIKFIRKDDIMSYLRLPETIKFYMRSCL